MLSRVCNEKSLSTCLGLLVLIGMEPNESPVFMSCVERPCAYKG
jgi:hypothetical protein